MVDAVDQSSYPFTPDPLFVPFQMQARVVFDNSLLSTTLNQNGASINFGPSLALYSPLTNSLRYGSTNPIGFPTVQSFDYSAYYGSWDKGSYIDFGQSSLQNLSATDIIDYNWAIVSPTMDPRYLPLSNPASYGASDLMSFLGLLQQDGTSFNYTEMSYEMINTNSPQAYYGTYYTYAAWYSGSAKLMSITNDASTNTPEPSTFIGGTGLFVLGLIRWRKDRRGERSNQADRNKSTQRWSDRATEAEAKKAGKEAGKSLAAKLGM
jgi:hypothetical protein